ncbi:MULTISPECIES: R3H domain-containing nucleic acid-binding protein [unclassified Leptolyngbya]|uniref:R3H domain-containing nucleic acid-binding protein n=1 Tax=unclassified Leptolyngbya TaxID=2650499 RepID=UPI00168227EC|nr:MULTISPECIES: R3H domain-containing nucleic acid-binding protein [unclassified Leptolyngbya]MBD1909040.1 AAA family ATPase [Leptolyngbya sp. FACHB-8]MBD2153032.1 AAA family ATPase [Leptolyngbya sp. FACHB-16]
MHNTNDLQRLLEILPHDIQQRLEQHPQRDVLVEVVLDLGRLPEARFPGQAEYLSQDAVTHEQLQYCIERVGHFGADNRAGIEQTLHRISAIRNRQGQVIGLTCRVGRAILGTIAMIRDLVETGQSILMLGRPGVGKTTALREIARVLADDLNKRVVIIDSSNEIAGDGDIPHPAIGRARRMQVAHPELQHQVMIEAVENHMPEVIVIDEIGTELEALAARTIAERGVQLVGTAHGNQLENLIKNPTLSDLVGGIQSVTLGDDEARRRGSQKSVLERKAPPTFEIAVEMQERQTWTVHESVADTVDRLLRGQQPNLQTRSINEQGHVTIMREVPKVPLERRPQTAQTTPFSANRPQPPKRVLQFPQHGEVEFLTERQSPTLPSASPERWDDWEREAIPPAQDTGERGLAIYPYQMSRNLVQQVIAQLNLPVRIVGGVERADAILTLRANLRKHHNLRSMAEGFGVPIYAVKANTIAQIANTLQQALGMETQETHSYDRVGDVVEGGGDGENELDALEEARLAVEQVVIPKGQPVELLPRSPRVRAMQHELIERYRLKSSSFGTEPNCRLRIYPA